MTLLTTQMIAIIAFCISILSFIVFSVILKKYKVKFAVQDSQYQSHELLLNNLQVIQENLKSAIEVLTLQLEKSKNDNAIISKQLEHRIKALQTQIASQQDHISQLQTDQGQNKFYSRAIKLAKMGAEIDEIVAECELPYAEVEMLISVYQNKA